MNQPFHNELKKEFQLERMILFSDAVFAIAITLLAIEIKVPEIPKEIVTDQLLIDSLDHLIPKLVGFFISFMIVGLYWTVHHRMFGYVINYDKKLLWLNLFFLLAVALMPFSTGFYSVYILRLLKTPVIIYVANICLLGFTNFLLWRHITNTKKNLSQGVRPVDKAIFQLRSITVPLIFIITAIIYMIKPLAAIWIPPFVPLIIRLIAKRVEKKYEKKHKLTSV